VEAVEQRAAVERDGLLEPAGLQQALELLDIAGDDGGIERQPVAHRAHGVIAQRVTQDVERVGQLRPRPVGRRLGPEEGDQLVARERAPAGEGQQREQREAPALCARPVRTPCDASMDAVPSSLSVYTGPARECESARARRETCLQIRRASRIYTRGAAGRSQRSGKAPHKAAGGSMFTPIPSIRRGLALALLASPTCDPRDPTAACRLESDAVQLAAPVTLEWQQTARNCRRHQQHEPARRRAAVRRGGHGRAAGRRAVDAETGGSR
jgi:hypothetical protein